MNKVRPELQILLPVHNEAGSIERVIKEIYKEISPKVRMEFIISEDGSIDGTKEILRGLKKKVPMVLISDKKRKGYTKAVIDGLKKVKSDYLLCLDSDGQCDPRDFWKFWRARKKGDLLIGNRFNRQDNIVRKTLSRGFYHFYKMLFPIKLKDPSCPFILTTKELVRDLLPNLGSTDQGFWWEFIARAYKRSYKFKQFNVNHRLRLAGETQVYKPKKMFMIGVRHIKALFEILSQENKLSYSR